MRKSTVVIPADNLSQASVYDPEFLRRQVHWLRNELDPRIARDGPDALHSDEVLMADEFFRRLINANISAQDIRYSRVHLAVSEIVGKGTRWPKRLIERCEALKTAWEAVYGPLKDVGILLYEPGGRLHGICEPEDLDSGKLIMKWIKSPSVKVSPISALRSGDLGFRPGSWWINSTFALRDGIINNGEPKGGIVADARGAYAIVMTDSDEISGSRLGEFTYRARNDDRGRYRLTAATSESRDPVRILRSHSLRSFCTPKAGLRYDGLHKVTGWCIKMDSKTRQTVYDISLKRLPSELSMDEVLRQPYAEEIEDYKEYKRLRHIFCRKVQDERLTAHALKTSGDGIFEDETAEAPSQSKVTDKMPPEEILASARDPLTPTEPRQDSHIVGLFRGGEGAG